MTTDSTQLALDAIRQLFSVSRVPSRRVLVEMYQNDWERLSKLKEDLDLSWKDIFHAVVLWLDAFEADPETKQMLANMVRHRS